MKENTSQKINAHKEILRIKKMVKTEKKIFFQKISLLKRRHQIFFSFIIFCAITFLWRGFWNILDVYWFPRVPFFSSVSCMFVGLVLLFFTNELIRQLLGGGGRGRARSSK